MRVSMAGAVAVVVIVMVMPVIMTTAGSRWFGVVMPAAATFVRMRMGVIVPMIVVVSAATCTVGMSVVVIMVVIIRLIVIMVVTTAVIHFLSPHGSKIKDAQQDEADAASQRHRAEPTFRHGRQVVRDAATDVEEEHHTTPENEEGDADKMKHGFLDSHGSAG